jgi:hypothetical protein
MKSIYNILLIGLAVGLFLGSCKEEPPQPPPAQTNPFDTITNFQGLLIPSTGKLNVKVTYSYGSSPLIFDKELYANMGGDTFTISLIRHYLSNITLIGDNGKVNLNDYHLINAEETPSTQFQINNVPAGVYKSVSAILGVDSLRNGSGLQEGALDPAYGMFWTWATGYIFFKFEGTTTKGITFGTHVGSSKSIPVNTASLLDFKIKSTAPTITFNINLKEMLMNPNIYSFVKDGHDVHSPADPANLKILQNMQDMMTVTSILQ